MRAAIAQLMQSSGSASFQLELLQETPNYSIQQAFGEEAQLRQEP